MSAAVSVAARERRSHPRMGVMLPALLDQYPVTITDLSVGGIGTGNLEMMFDGELGPRRGDRASLRFLQEDVFSDAIEVEIVRVSARRGSLGARYLQLTSEQKRLIKALQET